MTLDPAWAGVIMAGLGLLVGGPGSIAAVAAIKNYREERARRDRDDVERRRSLREAQARKVAVWPDPEKRLLFVRNDSDLPVYRVQARWLASMGGDSVAFDYSIHQPALIPVVPPHETITADVPEGTKVWREAEVLFIDAAGNAWRSWRGSLTVEPWLPAGFKEDDLNDRCGHRLRRLCQRCGWCVDCYDQCGCAGPVAQQTALRPPPADPRQHLIYSNRARKATAR